ncbi:zinc finger MYM-type protein 6-like [Diabrotica undecimpunctata]|uniref:zinc finger MYM-type protein 6-like n=1 Tax=Diabrotica undecimpunctata TaxID=50387 RepID=UPI003B63CC2D
METRYKRKGRGDELKIVRQLISFGAKEQHYRVLAACLILALVVIELQSIIAAILLFNKCGTWKALNPYLATFAILQPGCAGMFMIITFLSNINNILDTIAENTKKLLHQDELFENCVAKEARNIKTICVAAIVYSFTAHMLFALPSVLNDYDINIVYWLIREYYGTYFSSIMIWITGASIIIASCTAIFPIIFFGYFKFHICLQLHWIAHYIEQKLSITTDHDSYIQNRAYQDMVYTEIKAAVKYNLTIKRKNINIISAREIVSEFGLKLQYWRQKVEPKKTATFSRLALFLEDCKNITFVDIKDTIVRHLIKLRKRFSDYFPDLDTLTLSCIADPFTCEIAMIPEEPSGLAEAILELRSNIQFESKPNLLSFWMSKAAKAFKIVHEDAVKKLLPFGTTYLCEQGFSTLMNIKTKNRNRLNAEDCVQIALTPSPNVEAIVSNMKPLP